MKDKLFTKDYYLILLANFLLFFGFWILIPVMPFYLRETFLCGNTMIGAILSCYTISALCIRPFSGYLLDSFARKPLYLLSYFFFTAMFVGYILAGTLSIFIMVRIVHGLSFGTVTVGGNTVVIDIMPASRRGEGLGYYGLTNNLSMSIGPMVGLFMFNNQVPFKQIFACGLLTCFLGFLLASCVHTPYKPPVKREPVSLDRFILLKGIPAGIALLLISIPYGMTTNYIAMYAHEIGITGETGFFFTYLAVGMAISRLFSGRWVDKGYVIQVITIGFSMVMLCFFLLAFCSNIIVWNKDVCNILFFAIALFLGIGFGLVFPAYNTLFVNLAPNNQRGTATSTYLTSWDVGIGLSMIGGGYIAEISTFDKAYLFGAGVAVLSLLLFQYKVIPHFRKNRLR